MNAAFNQQTAAAPRKVVVAGLGLSGVSSVRYLHAQGLPVAATDTRAQPPGLAALGGLQSQIELKLGGFDTQVLQGAKQLVVSPGISLKEPLVQAAQARGIEVLGDIELFARAVNAGARTPTVAVTGTNGKSTVTTLVAQMAEAAGLQARAGGNLGEPALDLLAGVLPQLFVLELSSFQLDTTSSLRLKAATVLNVSPDHMDRYDSVADYSASKARIFMHCETAVINLDDPRVAAMLPAGQARLGFSAVEERDCDFGLCRDARGRLSLARRRQPLLALAEMKLAGLHNAANALAALALGEAAGLPLPAMLDVLRNFAGLPHRMQWVADTQGVRWINDSKGTNVGATCAAVSGMSGPLLIIAGGDGKGQDFAPLAPVFDGKVTHAFLIGRDAPAVAKALEGHCRIERCATLEAAVAAAARTARAGDTVLLSPACASLDMFRDYRHRGESFVAAVRALGGQA
jgi:UDP-N-acetylmuramoylalanine--D-glutamate ligase